MSDVFLEKEEYAEGNVEDILTLGCEELTATHHYLETLGRRMNSTLVAATSYQYRGFWKDRYP